MTGINENNKFIPKTYEVRFIEQQEPSKLTKIASYLGILQVECSGDSSNSSKEVEKAISTRPSLYCDSQTQSTIESAARGVRNEGKPGDEASKAKEIGNKETGDYYSETVAYKSSKK